MTWPWEAAPLRASRGPYGICRATPKTSRADCCCPARTTWPAKATGLAFSIIGEPPRISWERDPVAMSADDALAAEGERREQKPGPEAEALDAASTWLRSALAAGPRLAKNCSTNGATGMAGANERWTVQSNRWRSKRTAWKSPARGGGDCRPRMPSRPEDEQLGNLGTLGENTGNPPISDGENCKDAKLLEPGNLDAEQTATRWRLGGEMNAGRTAGGLDRLGIRLEAGRRRRLEASPRSAVTPDLANG